MRTSNPALNERTFRGLPGTLGETMTLEGTVNRTGILLLLAMATAAWVWHLFMQSRNPEVVFPMLLVGTIGGLIFAIATTFKPVWAPFTAPAYALLEGLALGGISAVFEMRFPGIAIEAVALTFGVLFVMLFLYRSGIIRVTQKFRIGVIAATGAIALFYLGQMLLGFFGVHFLSIAGSSPLSIGISLVITAVAALNLVLDFDMIETGVRMGAPKYMEWYGAFGLMVTLVWLYLELLRLLSKMRSRN